MEINQKFCDTFPNFSGSWQAIGIINDWIFRVMYTFMMELCVLKSSMIHTKLIHYLGLEEILLTFLLVYSQTCLSDHLSIATTCL